MKSIYEYKPKDRPGLMGMWAEHPSLGLVIISATDGVNFQGFNTEIVYFHQNRPLVKFVPNHMLTPREDLPRAWSTDGFPARKDT